MDVVFAGGKPKGTGLGRDSEVQRVRQELCTRA